MIKGVVIESTGSWYVVELADGSKAKCKLKGRFKSKGIKNTNPIAVGDHVAFEWIEQDKVGLIAEIEERRNYIIRKSTKLSKQNHIIASNIDQAVLVACLVEPSTSTGFIDRFLITAEAYSIPSILVFNKLDIYSEQQLEELESLTQIYSGAGYETIHVSAKTGANLNVLQSVLKGKHSLLSGHSGVGKSALINAIDPSKNVRIGKISDYHSKGTHTTTNASMYTLSFGAHIIDTPGIKEFGLIDFHKEELSHYFPEMRQFLGECKYNNCLHEKEKSCRIKQAVEEGEISQNRYDNYLRLLHDDDLPDYENQYMGNKKPSS
jgi:ribosome biogenesis GTPase